MSSAQHTSTFNFLAPSLKWHMKIESIGQVFSSTSDWAGWHTPNDCERIYILRDHSTGGYNGPLTYANTGKYGRA